MGATRIQQKSRVAKKVMATADYSTGGDVVSNYVGKKPRSDPRGFPAFNGLPAPVLVGVTIIA